MKIVLGYALTYIYIFGVLLLTNILKKKKNYSDETSRKIVHVLVTFNWIIMIYFFSDTWHLIIPPVTFLILNYISYKKDIFKVMELNDKKNNSLGTVYYPISTIILSVLTVIDSRFIAPYGIGMFCMGLGDGLAPYFGHKFKSHVFRIFGHEKTLYGSLTVFIFSILASIIFTLYFNLPLTIIEIIVISFIGSVLELIGVKGLDNLFLPLGTAILSYLFIIF